MVRDNKIIVGVPKHTYSIRASEPLVIYDFELLNTVTIRSESVKLDLHLNHLKKLKIIVSKVSSCALYCPGLEELYYDDHTDSILSCIAKGNFQDTLRALTIRRWPKFEKLCNIGEFKSLEHIVIIQSQDPALTCIETTLGTLENLKTIDIHYWNVPTGAHEMNLICNLNEDCLRHILQYLSLKQCMIIGALHPRFQHVVTFKYKETNLNIALSFFNQLPLEPNMNLYQDAGQFVTQLVASEIPQADFFKLLSLLPKLKVLDIFDMDLTDPEIVQHLPKHLPLESLTEVAIEFTDDVMRPFYRLVNPTLHTLETHMDNCTNCLLELTNIRNLSFRVSRIDADMLQFVEQNKTTMESICISDGRVESEDDESVLWAIVSQMENLKSLALYLNYLNIQMDHQAFPLLKEVKVLSATDHDLQVFLINSCPGHIKELSVPNELAGLGLFIAARFPQLQKLSIRNGTEEFESEDIDDWMSLRLLTQLETLNLRGLANFPHAKVIELIRSLPRLVDLTVPHTLPLEITVALKEDLRMANRTLRLNSG